MSCEKETLEHKVMVSHFMNIIIQELIRRAEHHDDSKLEGDELPLFDEYTPKLKQATYDSEEYREFLKGLKPALDHHYAVNRHHPEHYPNSVRGMDLIDLVEMICDWAAAAKRQMNGNALKSVDINKVRFGYDEDLSEVFKHTLDFLDM